MSAGGLVSALALTSLMGVFAAAIVIPPLRFLLKKVLPAPGQGRTLKTKLVHFAVLH